jgi:hypothetical protein
VVQVHPPDFFIFEVILWKMIIVVPANGTHWKKAYAVTEIANTGLISDALMIVVNVGRANNANSR